MKLAEVFSKAATALEGSEFSQGFADARPGTMCAGQAIEAVAGNWDPNVTEAYTFFHGLYGDTITAINDRPDTTKEQMVMLLSAAAKVALEEGK